MKFLLPCLLTVCLLLATTVAENALPALISQLPSNYSYPLLGSRLIESDQAISTLSVKDSQGNIYSCFGTSASFTVANVPYIDFWLFFVKVAPDLSVPIHRNLGYNNSPVKIKLDKQEKFLYIQLDNRKIIKLDVQSGNLEPVAWENENEEIAAWDIVDDNRLIISHRLLANSTSALFSVCPSSLITEYIAIAIVNSTSILSYKCLENQDHFSQIVDISYYNGKVYLFGKFVDKLLLNQIIVLEAVFPGLETAFIARLDWQGNNTDFAVQLGYVALFSSIVFTKDYSAVSFVFINKGTSNLFGRVTPGGVRIIRLSLPSQTGVLPQLMYMSPEVALAADADENFVFHTDSSTAVSSSAFAYRFRSSSLYDLAVIPIESNGLISNFKWFPVQFCACTFTVYSVHVNNSQSQVTVVFGAANTTAVSGILSQRSYQLAYVTLQLPVVPISVPEPAVIQTFENVQESFPNLISNGTNFVIEGNVTLNTEIGVTVVLTKDTEIATTESQLTIDLFEANINLESYTSESPPAAFDVFSINSSTPIGQLVGNGYQISSNARISNAEICINIASRMKLRQSFYRTESIAIRVAGVNRFQTESSLVVVRRGNQFCTRAATSAPIVYPALIGFPSFSSIPQRAPSMTPISASMIVSISFAVIVSSILLVF